MKKQKEYLRTSIAEKLIYVLAFLMFLILINLGNNVYATMRGLPTTTTFHTGSPYYVGGDSSDLNPNPTGHVSTTYNNYTVGSIRTRKIHHTVTGQNRAVYCLDITTEFPGSTAEAYTYSGNLMNGDFNIPRIVGGIETEITVNSTMRGQLRWLFDQFYIRENQSIEIKQTMKRNLFDNVAKYYLQNKAGTIIPNPTLDQIHNQVDILGFVNILNDSDLEVAQQWAVWELVNGTDAPAFNGGYPSITDGFGTLDPSNIDSLNLRQLIQEYLYETALTKDGNYKNEEVEPEVDTTSIQAEMFSDGINSFAIKGYQIKVGSNGLNNSNDKSIVTSVELLDKDNNVIPRTAYNIGIYSTGSNPNYANVLPNDRTLWDVVNEDRFFVVFPESSSMYASQNNLITLKINYRNITTYPFVYVPDDKSDPAMQSVVMLDRDAVSKEFTHSTEIPQGYDLALRKSIISINGASNFPSRRPIVDTSNLKLTNSSDPTEILPIEQSTAQYKHPKNPLPVKVGDKIKYEITVYNEDRNDKIVTEVKDMLPSNLRLVPASESTINQQNGWVESEGGRLITATLDSSKGFLKGAIQTGSTVSINGKATLEVELYVTEGAVEGQILTNIAEVSQDTPINRDRDSQVNNMGLSSSKYTDAQLAAHTGAITNKTDLSDQNYFYRGIQDDDDFESVIVYEPKIDLALKKFITEIKDVETSEVRNLGTSRQPQVNTTNLQNGTSTQAEYTKNLYFPSVTTGSEVKYTIRIFNEGDYAAYASEVKDNIPEGLEFLPDHPTNINYGWTQTGNELFTNYLSYEKDPSNLIPAFNKTTGGISYKDLEIVFKVKDEPNIDDKLRNIAEISEDADENNNPIDDRDSTPNNNDLKEDDIDYEDLKLVELDLNLKKFISKINGENVEPSREPIVDTTPLKNKTNTDANYTLSKDPVEVKFKDEVTYTIRIYNEGKTSAYADEVRDTIPEDMEYIIDNPINKDMGWKMYDSEGNETSIALDAVEIRTENLARKNGINSNIINGFSGQDSPYYKDLQVVFRVKTSTKTNGFDLKNIAEITDHTDEEGNKPKDRDSTPDNNNPDEDDQDYEDLIVKNQKFDLALLKIISSYELNQNGIKETKDTGHTFEMYPEPTVKIDLGVAETDQVEIKYTYKIQIENQGNVPGAATEITDYIPQGLVFNQADNPLWETVSGETNIVTTDQLKDKILDPGEKAVVEIVLRWDTSSKQFGLQTNVAEISKDYNEYGLDDIDSTPNNRVQGEDDIDDASTLITIETGAAQTFYIITLSLSTLIGMSAISIKRYII